jgi:choline dehydrogenase-like flavoprotein
LTRNVLIVGAGPAAAAAALACSERDDVTITVIDVGAQLEEERQLARSRLFGQPGSNWDAADLGMISERPVRLSKAMGVPEKRTFGSDFPFRDVGQRAGMSVAEPVDGALVSGAYGGFSNVWGAQIMPFTERTFEDWPISSGEMRSHYRHVLRAIPYAGEEDDLAGPFPLLAPATPLPPLSDRSSRVLSRYREHRVRLNSRGVTLGRARLAMRSPDCVRCGLCMTGCPHALIYSAAHTLDALRRRGRLTYHSGLLAVRVEEDGSQAVVVAREVSGRGEYRFTADRVLIACGAIGSSRLVMGSLGLLGLTVDVAESAQFLLPFVSVRPSVDPRRTDDFTLNQFNMVVDLDGGHDVSQLHFYSFNTAFLDALPSVLRARIAEPVRREVLRRLTVALGYIPSWASPSFRLRASLGSDPLGLPDLTVSGGTATTTRNGFLRGVLRRVVGAAAALDLWPVLPSLVLSAPGKSYHWGGTFPHSSDPRAPFTSDLLGRVGPWRRVHMVDAAVFPTVPATTFTLTIMANAHRIADTALQDVA